MDYRILLSTFIIMVGLRNVCSWSYTGETGPTHWAARGYPLCSGHGQSPINIEHPEYDHTLTAFHLHGHATLGPDDLEIEHIGWSVKVAMKADSIGKANLTGGGLTGKYMFAQMHFNWGDDAHGSGHTLKGHRYPLEVNVVHFKEEYGNATAAKTHHDGLAVLAFFYTISETDNVDLEPFFSALEHIPHKGNKTAFASGLHFNKFMPSDKSKYYRYHGSMTHPPCKEVVVWSVFRHTLSISSEQLAKFRHLYFMETNDHMTKNHRPTQPLGSRTVKASYQADSAVKTQLSIVGIAFCALMSMFIF